MNKRLQLFLHRSDFFVSASLSPQHSVLKSVGEISMRRSLYILLLTLALGSGFNVSAQSASKIIDRYKKASGGDAVKKIKNTVISGSVKVGEGLAGSFSQQTAQPDRL